MYPLHSHNYSQLDDTHSLENEGLTLTRVNAHVF